MFKAPFIISLLLISGILATGLAQGSQTFTWDSPHHLYGATDKEDAASQISSMQITSLTDSAAHPRTHGSRVLVR